MRKDSESHIGTRIDEFGRRYRLWFVIPLLIAAAMAFWSRSAALFFVIVMLCIWAFLGAVGLVVLVIVSLLPQRMVAEHKEEIQQSIGVTLFLGGCAVIGIVLRDENALSEFVERKVPEGFYVAFIDPTFAVVCIIGTWIYTGYRLRK